MIINRKTLFKQLASIYKTHGIKGIIIYIYNAYNYIITNRYVRGSYSQMGEDIFIDKFFHHRKRGFYIDIGAYDPSRLSNTKFFYDKGWRGINIEPNSSKIKSFLKARTRDINLEIGIGRTARKVLFYEFEAASLSTFSKKEALSLLSAGYKLKRTFTIEVRTLSEIMKKYVTDAIDFMTVDTEGTELDALQSNDWNRYRPKLLCVETIDSADLLGSSRRKPDRKIRISQYLLRKGYKEYFDNGLNTFYRDTRHSPK